MKQKILGLLITCCGLFVSASLAQAAELTATHTLVSQQQTTNGTDVVLNITVNNPSASALNAITMDMADLTLWAEPGTNVLTVGFLAAGGSANLVWSITSTAPSFMSGSPLAVLVKASDANNQPVEFSIMSAGD